MTFRKSFSIIPAAVIALTPVTVLAQSDQGATTGADAGEGMQVMPESDNTTAQTDGTMGAGTDEGGANATAQAQGDATTGGTMSGDSDAMTDSQTADAGSDMAPTEGEDVAGYDHEKLSSFVDAAMTVSALRQTYAVRMQAAEDDEARQKLAEEATGEMRSAIEEADGITVDEYVEIGEASTKDEDLNQAITAMVRERIPQDGQQPSNSEG